MPTTRSQTSRRMESNGGAHSLDASITEDESDDEIDQHQPPAKGIKNRKATPRTEKEERFPNYPRPDKSEIPPLSSPVDNVQQGKTSTPSGGPYGLGYLSIFLSWRVVFVCVVCGLSWLFAQYSQRNVKVKFSDLKTLFSSQDPEMWDHLRAGLMPDKVGGVQNFLFLHSSPRTVDCFLKTLTQNDCYTFKAREIVNSDPFVESFKDKLLDYKCLVVFDLEDLHPDGVVVLKGFCDPHDPIVPNSKFFFALNAGPDMDADAYKLARNLLETKWLKNLTHDDFGGTLTRLTQNVLKIRDEPKLPC